ncbi:hypothetical protein VTN49DRAFT_3316 [Thermomyces lanuginosus]|uniref:uncharacterized protein n=1 Tax=Thermomyces lanuginosus TaxID=5541 RepID=UPI0037420AB5
MVGDVLSGSKERGSLFRYGGEGWNRSNPLPTMKEIGSERQHQWKLSLGGAFADSDGTARAWKQVGASI